MSNTSHPRVIYIAPLSPWLVLQNLILPLIIKSMSITYITESGSGPRAPSRGLEQSWGAGEAEPQVRG